MDPMSPGPEEHRPGDARRPEDRPAARGGLEPYRGDPAAAGPKRSPREQLTPALTHLAGAAQTAPPPVRTVQLVTGDFLVTVNPVDGSEIEPCPRGRRPAAPRRRNPAERAAAERAGRPPIPAGPAAPPVPLIERHEERERLIRLLSRGRSVRLVGAHGSGRTSLLDAVAAGCQDLAPDGVVRLSGHHRTTTELLYALHDAVLVTPCDMLSRPDRAELLARVRDIGAIVLVDDCELSGDVLDDLLAATPECAHLVVVAPESVAPQVAHTDLALEEVLLAGLSRAGSLDLLERAVERSLSDAEKNWAGDLWFESEGLPLRFVQAAALLRQRDRLRGDPQLFDEFEPFAKPSGDRADTAAGTAFDHAFDGTFDSGDSYDIPLPTLGEGAAPAELLASRLSESARTALRFAVALGGEVPHQAHLPALVGDTHADAALGELMSCALITPVGPRYRLAHGVTAQLQDKGYADGAAERALTAAQHYAWWSGHPSVTPERVAAEADALAAAVTTLLPGHGTHGRTDIPGLATDDDKDRQLAAAVRLARSAAPALAAALNWGAWERMLRTGQEAARYAGEVAEEAYFHHELGVLALCSGNLDRARAELEASIGMRGVVADRSGTVAGRRALALVTDLEIGASAGRGPVAESGAPIVAALPSRPEPVALPPGVSARAGAAVARAARRSADDTTKIVRIESAAGAPVPVPATRRPSAGRRLIGGARRNLVAAGTGALLAAVLGTVVTLGATSGNGEEKGADHVGNGQTGGPDETDTPDPSGTLMPPPSGNGSGPGMNDNGIGSGINTAGNGSGAGANVPVGSVQGSATGLPGQTTGGGATGPGQTTAPGTPSHSNGNAGPSGGGGSHQPPPHHHSGSPTSTPPSGSPTTTPPSSPSTPPPTTTPPTSPTESPDPGSDSGSPSGGAQDDNSASPS